VCVCVCDCVCVCVCARTCVCCMRVRACGFSIVVIRWNDHRGSGDYGIRHWKAGTGPNQEFRYADVHHILVGLFKHGWTIPAKLAVMVRRRHSWGHILHHVMP
jgi:hypothetical protein